MTVMMTSSSSSSPNYHHATVVGGCGSSMSMIPPRLTTPSFPISGPSTSTAATARGSNSSGLSFVPHKRHYSGPSLSSPSASSSSSNTTSSRRKHRLTRRTWYNNSNDCNYYGDTTNDSSSNVVVDSGRHHHHHHHHDDVRYHRAVAFMQHFRRLHSLDIIEEHEDDLTMTKMKSMKRSETTSCLTSLVVDVEEQEDEDHLHGGGGGGHGNEDGPHAASPASMSHYNFKNKRSRHLSFVEDDYVSDIDSIVEEEEEPHDDEDDDHYDHHELHDNE